MASPGTCRMLLRAGRDGAATKPELVGGLVLVDVEVATARPTASGEEVDGCPHGPAEETVDGRRGPGVWRAHRSVPTSSVRRRPRGGLRDGSGRQGRLPHGREPATRSLPICQLPQRGLPVCLATGLIGQELQGHRRVQLARSGPGLQYPPHNHGMEAAIGLYSGVERNLWYRTEGVQGDHREWGVRASSHG